jgi:RHS repeat-associated protein
VRNYGSYPFGGTWYETLGADKWKFTSHENDSESGLNYAGARYQSVRVGRFTALDPVPGHRRNPQSLNRYTYANNDPINLIDPTGPSFGNTAEFTVSRYLEPGTTVYVGISASQGDFYAGRQYSNLCSKIARRKLAMSVFRDLHQKRQFDSVREYDEFRRMLQQTIDRGFVEELAPINPNPLGEQYWFRDKETGEIFTLTPPDFPSRGSWHQVNVFDQFSGPTQTKPS